MVTSLSPPGRRAAELKGSIQFPHPQPTRADRLTVALVALDRDMCSLKSQNTLPLSCIHGHTCPDTQSCAHIHQVITILGRIYLCAFHAFMSCIGSLRYPHSRHALFDVWPHTLTTPYCVFSLEFSGPCSCFSTYREQSNSCMISSGREAMDQYYFFHLHYIFSSRSQPCIQILFVLGFLSVKINACSCLFQTKKGSNETAN